MNRLSKNAQAEIVGMLVEGNSVRAVSRMTGRSQNTILKLLADLGEACQGFHDQAVRDVPAQRVECDEVFSYVGCKERNVKPERRGPGVGTVWTWTALDSDSKLIVNWYVGDRSVFAAWRFMNGVAARLRNRVQLTTDGHHAYLQAVASAFGGDVDYAMLQKLYGQDREGEVRYSPPMCVGIRKERISGNPIPELVSTSYVERQNLTMRMQMRRFTRLTNAFSKKIENHCHAIALHFVWYNFVRVHKTLGTTPAVAAGLSKKPWSLLDLVKLVDVQRAAA